MVDYVKKRQQQDDGKTFNFSSPNKSHSSKLHQRPSSSTSSTSEKRWASVSTKVSVKRHSVLENKRRTHRIRSLTLRPAITQQPSLVPHDMRLSPKLPPVQANLKRLTLFLEQAETRLMKGYTTKDVHDLLLEKQLLYSATFAELSHQVSTSGGDRAAEFLNRIWKLNQGLFESFIKLHDQQIKKADEKVKYMQETLKKNIANKKRSGGFGKISNSITGIVMEQLRKIRQKKHLQKVAADEARIKALTNEVVFVAPTFDSNKSTLMDTPDIELSERDIVQAMEYSGCADELERFAAAMLRGAKNKMNDKPDEEDVSEKTNIQKDRWVQLPGVLVAVDHFSAIITVNMDLQDVLKRGQSIKFGKKTMCVHSQKGKMTAVSMPLDKFWEGEPKSGLSLYIRSSDSNNKTNVPEEESDMENEDEIDDTDWVVIPATVTVTKGDNLVVTSSDIQNVLKQGATIKIQNSIFTVADGFDFESFSTNKAWKHASANGLPLFAEATGIWGWDKEQDKLDKQSKKSEKKEESPWFKTGKRNIFLFLFLIKKNIKTTNADARFFFFFFFFSF